MTTPAVVAVTIADMIGVPMVMPTCWDIDASPVASPCSRSGSPAVAVTMKPTMTSMLPTPPRKVAGSCSHSEAGVPPRRSRAAVKAACSSPPPISAARAEVRPMTLGASRPPSTVPRPSRAKETPAARAEKPSVFCM